MPDTLDTMVTLPDIASSPSHAATEDAIVGSEDRNPDEPLSNEESATDYFKTVPEEEAMNYVMFLHDIHAISFDRMNELKELLGSTTSLMPLDK